MTEAELIAFLTENLEIVSVNKPDSYRDFDNFTVQILLKGNVISETVLTVNNGV